METSNIKNAMNKYGKDTIVAIAKRLKNMGAYSSGKLVKSLSYILGDGVKELMVNIASEDYIKNIEEGRKPNSKLPPTKSLTQWMARKGIPESAKFAIAKNIAKYGIKARPFLKDILKSGEDELISDIEDGFEEDINDWIDNNINNK